MTTGEPENRDQELEAPGAETEDLGTGAGGSDPPRSSRGRRIAAVVLLVLACVLAPLAALSIFLKNQVTDTDRYVRTITPLASNPDIQAAVAANVTNALFTRVDIEAEAEEALPERAKFLAVPLARGLENVTREATLRLLESEQFQELWVEINRIAHAQLVNTLTGEGEVLQTEGGDVVLNLAPVLEAVKQRLDERGIEIFDRVPPDAVSTSFILVKSDNLDTAQRGLDLLEALAIVLPILVLLAIGAAVALSRNRRRTLLQAGIGLAAAMLVLGAGLTAVRELYISQVAGPGLPEDAAAAFYDIAVRWLRYGIRAIFAIALLVAIGAFVTGPTRAAHGVRARFGSLVDWVAGDTGVRSSAAGQWVGANKRALRIAAIFVPAVIFLLLNAPTPAVLIVLIVLALVALLVIEIVAARPVSEGSAPQPAA
jgi:hypothetical protein